MSVIETHSDSPQAFAPVEEHDARLSIARRIRMGIVALAAATGFFLWALTWNTGPQVAVPPQSGPLPLISEVPDFSLTERSGRTITKADLLGSVWIADFIFTRCSGPCPDLSAKLRGLQYAFADAPDVKLVSICLDPENDTPANLVHYADRFQAQPDRWWFLTGTDEKYIHGLVEKGFLQSVVPEGDGSPLMHSTYFVVIDRQGRIRAAHDGVAKSAHGNLIRDVRALLAEPLSTQPLTAQPSGS